jgi:hypothetical protein
MSAPLWLCNQGVVPAGLDQVGNDDCDLSVGVRALEFECEVEQGHKDPHNLTASPQRPFRKTSCGTQS